MVPTKIPSSFLCLPPPSISIVSSSALTNRDSTGNSEISRYVTSSTCCLIRLSSVQTFSRAGSLQSADSSRCSLGVTCLLQSHVTALSHILMLRVSLCRKGAHGSVVGWDTVPQAGRSRVRFPVRSSIFFNLPNPSSRIIALGVDSASNRNEYQ
jgi:hypothetical protein